MTFERCTAGKRRCSITGSCVTGKGVARRKTRCPYKTKKCYDQICRSVKLHRSLAARKIQRLLKGQTPKGARKSVRKTAARTTKKAKSKPKSKPKSKKAKVSQKGAPAKAAQKTGIANMSVIERRQYYIDNRKALVDHLEGASDATIEKFAKTSAFQEPAMYLNSLFVESDEDAYDDDGEIVPDTEDEYKWKQAELALHNILPYFIDDEAGEGYFYDGGAETMQPYDRDQILLDNMLVAFLNIDPLKR